MATNVKQSIEEFTKRRKLSRTVRLVLSEAAKQDHGTLTVSDFLDETARYGRATSGTAASDFAQLLAADSELSSSAPPHAPETKLAQIMLAPALMVAIDEAIELRRRTGGNDDYTGVRYILFALATSKDASPEVDRYLQSFAAGWSARWLAQQMIPILEKYRERNEDWEIWSSVFKQNKLSEKTSGIESDVSEIFDNSVQNVVLLAWSLAATSGGADSELHGPILLDALQLSREVFPNQDEPLVGDLRRITGIDDTTSRYSLNLKSYLPSRPTSDSSITARPISGRMSQTVQDILRVAQEIAKVTSSSEIALLPHLAAAFIVNAEGEENGRMANWFRRQGVSPELWREAIMRSVELNRRSDDQDAWARVLLSVPDITTVRPDLVPESPRSHDALGLVRYADAMGGMIAARNQRPPISIAIFGPWGSGKSFFMAMIREAVGKFTGRASANSGYVSRVVQIEFNAWHYVEASLWASLIHAVLEGLQESFDKKGKQSSLDEALDRLQLGRAELREHEVQLKAAQDRKLEAAAALANAQELHSEKAREEAKLRAEDVVGAFRHEFLHSIGPTNDNGEKGGGWLSGSSEALQKIAKQFGYADWSEAMKSLVDAKKDEARIESMAKLRVAEVEDLIAQARETQQRGVALVGWLAQARVGWLSALGLIIATVVPPTIALGLLYKYGADAVSGPLHTSISILGSTTLPILGVLGGAMAWLRKRLGDFRRVLGSLETVRTRIDSEREKRLSKHDGLIERARSEVDHASAEVIKWEAAAAVARKSVELIEETVRSQTKAQRLKSFVAQRLTEGEYQRHLGLLHTIRADMQNLGVLLGEVHKSELEKLRKSGMPPGNDEHPVERIVLYIDDLDRCPARRVVEVLEAIHLLLAFPLFVVVVGVDVRWVEHGLERRYPGQLGYNGRIASPLDYLEKVFQIPFWLPVMDAAGGGRLLREAISPEAWQPSQTQAPNLVESEPPGVATGVETGGEIPNPGGGGQDGGTIRVGGRSKVDAPDESASDVAAGLRISQAEQDLIASLAGVVGNSPRRARRFANLYRLLRASLTPAERRRFVREDGTSGTHIQAALLLALSTGAPTVMCHLLSEISDRKDTERLDNVLANLSSPDDEQNAVDAAIKFLKSNPSEATTVELFRPWVSVASRFVFQLNAQPLAAGVAPKN